MAQLLATYSSDRERHRIELVRLRDGAPRDGALLLDRPSKGAPCVVAELSREEGVDQALAVLHAGGYLERATAGEPGLCRVLVADQGLERAAAARAA